MEWVAVAVVPALLAIGGGIGGWITLLWQHRLEEIRATEERLSADRRKVYGDLLLPYIQLFADLKDGGREKAIQTFISPKYRATAFDFMLIASDDAARAYNELMQFIYKMEPGEGGQSWEILRLWGSLLLQIRRSLGNKDTALTNVDMLRSLIKDIEMVEEHEAKRTAGQDGG